MKQRLHRPFLIACCLSLLTTTSTLADEEKPEDARSCISLRALKRTEIVDDQTIFFFMSGQTVYLNLLPRACRGLSREQRFSYRVSGSRLCSHDRITILTQLGIGLSDGRSCRLGYFQPIDKATVSEIKERSIQAPAAEPPAPPEPVDITTVIDAPEDKPPDTH